MNKILGKSGFRQSTYAYALIAPGLILIAVIMIYPLIRGIISSFFSQMPASIEFDEFIGFQHFRELMSDKIFTKALSNTIYWTAMVVSIQYIIGLGTALLLNCKLKGRGIYRSLVLIPWVVPGIAAAMTWRWMYSYQHGLINQVLMLLGLIESHIDWLGSSEYAMTAVIITAIWKVIPFITIVLLASMQSIDQTLYEAVRIDGGGAFRGFWHITFVGIRDVSITTLLLQSIWTFNQFDLVFNMTRGGPSNTTMILPVYTYLTAFNFFNLNKAAAIGVISLLVVAVLAVAYIIYTMKKRHDV